MKEKYYDADGNEVSLDKLCRLEPAWAANVIRSLKSVNNRVLKELKTYEGGIWSKDSEYEWYLRGFNAAKDRAVGIAERHTERARTSPSELRASFISADIQAMQPEEGSAPCPHKGQGCKHEDNCSRGHESCPYARYFDWLNEQTA